MRRTTIYIYVFPTILSGYVQNGIKIQLIFDFFYKNKYISKLVLILFTIEKITKSMNRHMLIRLKSTFKMCRVKSVSIGLSPVLTLHITFRNIFQPTSSAILFLNMTDSW